MDVLEKTYLELQRLKDLGAALSRLRKKNMLSAPTYLSLRIQVSPKEGISPIILFWGWDWNPQSYSREVSGFLGYIKLPEIEQLTSEN